MGLKEAAFLAAILVLCGCKSLNVNPPVPEPGFGYADFVAEGQAPMSWDIQEWDAKAGRVKLLFSELKPLRDPALRLAMKPGLHRLRIGFLNRVVSQPAEVQLEIKDAQVTPVKVTLTSVGPTSVATSQIRYGASVRGRFRPQTKMGFYEANAYRVNATVGDSTAYSPKGQAQPR